MNPKKTIILLFIILFSLVGATSFYYYYTHKPEAIIFDMFLIVEKDNIIAFKSDTDAIYFGSVPRNGASSRIINITNQKEYDLLVNVFTEGEFSEWVNIKNSSFILKPNEIKSIKFSANVPGNAQEGNYTGKAYIISRRY
jgi:hypothetical protein